MNGAKMIGKLILDPHKNTATCKRVNDRLRRRIKRTERTQWKQDQACTRI